MGIGKLRKVGFGAFVSRISSFARVKENARECNIEGLELFNDRRLDKIAAYLWRDVVESRRGV
jgi:hypothetical protein